MSTPRTNPLTGLVRNDRGSVAIIFGLMATTLAVFAGLAVDYGRIVDLRGRIVDAADSATLAAGKALLQGELSNAEIEELASTFFVQNVGPLGDKARLSTPQVTIDRQTGDVEISVAATLGMTLARLAGVDTVNIPIVSEANFRQRDIEVGMALDITGSMGATLDGQRKIDALKDAFENFANRLLPDQRSSAQRVRIGLAPYSGSVNVGADAGFVSNNASIDGCITEADNGRLTDDFATYTAGSPASRDLDATEGRQGYACPNNTLLPLTDDRSALIREVRSYQPRGTTAGHIGAQWAWNLVSDNWASIFSGDSRPDSYSRVEDDQLLKAVIIMSDGIFNTAYNGGNSSQQAIRLCRAMKRRGIEVFTIAFGLVPGSDAERTLQTCASDGPDYFVSAASPEELNRAFERFADRLAQLRLIR